MRSFFICGVYKSFGLVFDYFFCIVILTRYICAAHHGLTEAELLDLLSCNDELMATIYKDDFPRIVRFPYRYWSAIRIDLGNA